MTVKGYNKRRDDHYTLKAKAENIVARSFYKLEEIDKKAALFTELTKTVLDIGCAPGSWLQYVSKKLQTFKHQPGEEPQIIGFDLKQSEVAMPYVYAYVQDITDTEWVEAIIHEHGLTDGTVDVIISDMAPDTMGNKEIDALRSIGLIERTLWIYDRFLKDEGKFVIKVFMGPGFDELIRGLKSKYGAGAISVFKPKACRKESKETYILKRK